MGLLTTIIKILIWYIVNLVLILLLFPYQLAVYIYQASINIMNSIYVNVVNTLIYLYNLIVDFVNTHMGVNWLKAELVRAYPIDIIIAPFPNIPHMVNLAIGSPILGALKITFTDVIFFFIGGLVLVLWNYVFFNYLAKMLN